MDHSITDLNALVAKGKAQGYLTYDQVNDYLPDEAVNPEKLDNLLMALDEMGIELVTDAAGRCARKPRAMRQSAPAGQSADEEMLAHAGGRAAEAQRRSDADVPDARWRRFRC